MEHVLTQGQSTIATAPMGSLRPLPCLPRSVGAARIPEWDLGALCHRACPVCNGDAPRRVSYRPDGLHVMACSSCGMLYLSDIPSTQAIARLYEQYGSFKRFAPQRLSWWEAKRAAARDPYIAILRESGGLERQSLIEIGCSFGRFLQLARDCGAEVTGVDLDDAALSHLQSLGIAGLKALPDLTKVDIVCAFNLLEHLEHPQDLIGKISRSLAEDGRFLLTVPNGGEYQEIGSSWLGFRVDMEHLNYFALKSLSMILNRLGLFVEQFWIHKQPSISRGRISPPSTQRTSYWYRKIVQRAFKCPETTAFATRGTFALTVLARKTSRNPHELDGQVQ